MNIFADPRLRRKEISEILEHNLLSLDENAS